MISLYIHIPFCDTKCDYCNFFVLAEDEIAKNPKLDIEKIKSEYISAIKNEINFWHTNYTDHEVRTIYIGGGTPSSIGANGLIEIIDHIFNNRDCEFIEELTIELNPNPFTKTLDLVKKISKKYEKNCPRVRFSFGIQSLDDEILALAKRQYVANNIRGFARELQKIKMSHNIYNFDMICFGTDLKKNHKEWLEDWIFSGMADSWSVYLLELFPGSKWHNIYHDVITDPMLAKLVKPDEEKVMNEYDYYHDLMEEGGYLRYEVSNRSRPGAQSIHNTIYRTMQPYIGIGASASGFVNNIRYTNTNNIRDYIKGNHRDITKDIKLSQDDIYYETVMLGLRTNIGVKNLSKYAAAFRSDYLDYIYSLTDNNLATYIDDKLLLTQNGLNVANSIISELMK